MAGKTTVVFFHLTSDSFSGAANMLYRLLRSLDEDEFRAILLTQRKGELYRRCAELDITVAHVPFRGVLDTYGKRLLDAPLHTKLRAAIRLVEFNLKALRTLSQADVLWCQNLRAMVTLIPFSTLSRTPLIWDIGLGDESAGWTARLNSLALRVSDVVCTEYEAQPRQIFTEKQFHKHREKFVVIHKGIDLHEYASENTHSGRVTNEVHIGTASTITERKGLHHFIEAAAMIVEEGIEANFYLTGEPPRPEDEAYREELFELVSELGIDDSVHFLGWVENMPEYYNSLDIFVLPSLAEGIPGAIREAFAMRLPVIATDVGGISEIVIEDQTGCLIEPNDPAALASAMKFLVRHPTERDRFGNNGRALIEREFSLEKYVDEYEQLLESVVD